MYICICIYTMTIIDYYIINNIKNEKQLNILNNEKSCGNVSYIPGRWLNYPKELTTKARESDKIMSRISNGDDIPERPLGSGNKGFYFNTGNIMAFRGINDYDLALYWHMITIPSLKIVQKNELKWVFDLNINHIPLLLEMKSYSLIFLNKNKNAFISYYGNQIKRYLKPGQIQFGFHTKPSIGYLHMHTLVGPITEGGNSDGNRGHWIHLDEIIELLMIEGDLKRFIY